MSTHTNNSQANQENKSQIFFIPEPNHTQTPNILLDNIDKFDGNEFKVIMAICRYTFGYRKNQFALSLSRLMELTGIKKRNEIVDALKRIQEMKLIEKTGNTKNGTDIYKLIVHNSDEVVTNGYQGGNQRLPTSQNTPPCSSPLNNPPSYNPPQNLENKSLNKKPKPSVHKYAENVQMTEKDYNKLCDLFGKDEVKIKLEEYDRWKYNNAVQRIDDYRGLKNWITGDKLKKERQNTNNSEIINKNIIWLKNKISHLERIGAKGNLNYNQNEVFDSVLNKRISITAKNMIDIVTSWDQFRR